MTSTIRRGRPMKPSRGTVWPEEVRDAAYALHRGCLGPRVGMSHPCQGAIELDHIRAGGMGMKSPSTLVNAASLCSTHHRIKTDAGRLWRPLLVELVDRLLAREGIADLDCAHVEPIHGCLACYQRERPRRS